MIRFVLVPVLFAVLVYLFVRLIDRRSHRPVEPKHGPQSGRRPGTQPERRTIAPDDDEQFLRELDRKRKDEPPTG